MGVDGKQEMVFYDVGPKCGSVVERVLALNVYEEIRTREVEDGHVFAHSYGKPYPLRSYRDEAIVYLFVREPSGGLKRIAVEGGTLTLTVTEIQGRRTVEFSFLGVRWVLPCHQACEYDLKHVPARELEAALTSLVGVGL